MNTCQAHWDKLREAIAARGLAALVPGSGEDAMRRTAERLGGDEVSIDNYDPLMAAHWAIVSNGMDIRERGGNPLWVMTKDDPNRPFPACTICCLNWMMDEHDRHCTDPDCEKPKGELAHYEWMIERAADDQVEVWKSLKL